MTPTTEQALDAIVRPCEVIRGHSPRVQCSHQLRRVVLLRVAPKHANRDGMRRWSGLTRLTARLVALEEAIHAR
jgi:hypothetical protein